MLKAAAVGIGLGALLGAGLAVLERPAILARAALRPGAAAAASAQACDVIADRASTLGSRVFPDVAGPPNWFFSPDLDLAPQTSMIRGEGGGTVRGEAAMRLGILRQQAAAMGRSKPVRLTCPERIFTRHFRAGLDPGPAARDRQARAESAAALYWCSRPLVSGPYALLTEGSTVCLTRRGRQAAPAGSVLVDETWATRLLRRARPSGDGRPRWTVVASFRPGAPEERLAAACPDRPRG